MKLVLACITAMSKRGSVYLLTTLDFNLYDRPEADHVLQKNHPAG